ERPLDASLDGHRAGVDLAEPDDPGVGRDLDDQRVLAAVALGLDLGEPDVDRLDVGDLQIANRCGAFGGHRGCPLWVGRGLGSDSGAGIPDVGFKIPDRDGSLPSLPLESAIWNLESKRNSLGGPGKISNLARGSGPKITESGRSVNASLRLP